MRRSRRGAWLPSAFREAQPGDLAPMGFILGIIVGVILAIILILWLVFDLIF